MMVSLKSLISTNVVIKGPFILRFHAFMAFIHPSPNIVFVTSHTLVRYFVCMII